MTDREVDLTKVNEALGLLKNESVQVNALLDKNNELIASHNKLIYSLTNNQLLSERISKLEDKIQLEIVRDERTFQILDSVTKWSGWFLVLVGSSIVINVGLISFGKMSLKGDEFGWLLANHTLLAIIGAALLASSLVIASRVGCDR